MEQGNERAPETSEEQDAPPDALVGRELAGRYRVDEVLARGGMGKVYRGEQAALGRKVAIKVLDPTYRGNTDPAFQKRFLMEAETCAKLTHPNTITIHDYGRTDDGLCFIVMELLEGQTLHHALRGSGPMSPARALHIARQVGRSLREAHGLGVVHRDLKPGNVFLVRHDDDPDFVKVLDFGLVKDVRAPMEDLTQTGMLMGSPKYMAPEQIRGERELDARADLYALGVILYEMLAGRPPFVGKSQLDVLVAHVHETPRPLTLDRPEIPGIWRVVERCLAKEPDDRYGSMRELLDALSLAAVEDGIAPPVSAEHVFSGEHVLSSDPGLRPEPSLTPSGVLVKPAAGGGASPATPAAPPLSAPEPEKGANLRLIALGVIVLAAIGIGAALALMVPTGADDTDTAGGPASDPVGGAAPEAPRPEPPIDEPPDEPVVAAPERLHVVMVAIPPEASFVLDGEAVGVGSIDRALEVDGRPHVLEVSAPGHASQTFTFTDAAPPIRVVLTPLRVASGRGGRGGRGTGATTTTTTSRPPDEEIRSAR
ncbi:MAG: serine/threonine protein kinase [Sandaracinaceae bacterium]|nr:serine/threonine protein kinase [Sandaracinaceae bacterium]